MGQMPEKLNAYISVGITNSILERKYILVEADDLEKVLIVDKLIEKLLDNIDNTLIRDAGLINLNANYSGILQKYFEWLSNYLDLTRFSKDSIIEINIYENIYNDKLTSKKMYMLKDSELVTQHNKLRQLILELHVNRNDYNQCQEILSSIVEYKNLVELYYPEIEKELDNMFGLEVGKTNSK